MLNNANLSAMIARSFYYTYNYAVSWSVITLSNRSESLLPSSVPDLQLKFKENVLLFLQWSHPSLIVPSHVSRPHPLSSWRSPPLLCFRVFLWIVQLWISEWCKSSQCRNPRLERFWTGSRICHLGSTWTSKLWDFGKPSRWPVEGAKRN